MVKNIPTIERSTKIRFGKHATDDQAENTIVFNASNVAIDASTAGGVYVTPMRTVDPSTPEITVLSYNTITKEIVNSDTKSADLFNSNLHFVSQRGNVTSNTLQFTNPTTAFITTGGVGIGSSVLINSSAANQIQVSGTTKTGALHADKIGIANTAPTHALSLGNEGQLRLNVPTGSIYALETVGNVSAQNYIGDGGLLSNVTLQTVTDKSNITSNTLLLTNPTTSLKAYSNVIVDGNVYGKIAGSNTIAGSTITASTQFSGPGTGLTGIPTDQFVSGAIALSSGGTGQTSYASGTILYGKTSGDSLGQLNPAGSNADAGKFLRLDSSDIPEWAEVPLTLDAVLGDTTAVSDGSMSLTDTGTTITTLGKIKAVTFEGGGSELQGINAANVAPLSGTFITSVLPVVPVTKGGTGLNSVSTGDILYASGTDQIANLAKGAANKILQMDSGANIPEWTSTITGATLSGPTLTGVITATGLSNNSIPFTNGSGELVSDTKLQFDGVDTMTIGSNLTISGNLLVQGNTTFQHTQNHTISDPLIELGNANASDTIDMGVIMTRPTANVVAGYMGDEKKYVIAYTHSDPLSPHIVPTNSSSDKFMTLSVEGGNVLAGNTTTTGKMTAGTLHGDSVTVSGAVTGGTLVGDGSAITVLNPANLSSQVLLAKGGTGLTTVAENELLLGPASGTALTKLTPYAPAATTVEYPTSALSSAANSGETIAGVTYTTTASSNQYGEIWKAFDKTTPGQNTFWHSDENVYDSTSGAYTGSKSLGGVSGEWIKLQLSTGIAPTSVNITGRTSYDNQAPDSWEILGSNDDISWTSLLSSTVHATYNGGSGHTVSISGASSYTYLALVVKAKGGTGQTAVVLSEVRFFVSVANLSKKFLRSSGTGIAWDDVSSTLQAITDGGATTTHTIAFNNATTGLTSAGDIDIAATKQIDYAGDVLLKSSAGAVASLKVTNAVKLDPAYAAPSNNVLSFNTTTGEIYDSGGQGGSTLDNIIEEGANVAIGPSAASANLTINTYGSNVLTVSGNVSADSITIGGLNIAASPFSLDDVSQATVGANVTSNVIQFTGPHSSYNSDNAFVTTNSIKIGSNVNVTGNLISQNIQLTNPGITAAMSSTDTITIDAKNKSYGTAPLVQLAGDLNSLVYSDLIDGAQIVVPIFASGADRKISKNLTNVNWYVQTSDLTIKQSEHGLMTLSNVAGNVYMNSISFTQN